MISSPVVLNKIRSVVFSNEEPSYTTGVLWGKKDENNNYVFYAYNDGAWEPIRSESVLQEVTIFLGETRYDSVDNIVFLPAYPTTLPASDVYEWAKAANKPSYSYSEISNTPTIPSALSDLTDDASHRLVTDTQISHWEGVYGIVPASAYDAGNEIADKNFVNSSIATATATYKGNYNLVTDLSLTTAASHSDIQTALATEISTVDNNDYCFVEIPVADATPTLLARVERYKFNRSVWSYEYTLNNSSFTSDQWAAINSGITTSLVTTFGNKYDKPSGGIPGTDLASAVQTSLGKADSAVQPASLATVATSGSYNDLLNRPTIPAQMVVLSYGSSTWAEFLAAYQANAIVYCRASSSSNPATGTQGRMAFMAYVNNATTPTEVEFQYYRSVNSHSSSQQGDQVFVYKLASSGTWTVTTREAATKIVAGTNMTSSYSNGVLTLNSVGGSADMDTDTFSGTTLTAVANTYYTATAAVNTLAVTLPAVSDTTKTKCIIINLSTSSSPNITFTSADSKTISYYASYNIEASKEYEINIIFNGSKWIIASAEIATA